MGELTTVEFEQCDGGSNCLVRLEKKIGGFEWLNQESVGGANDGVGGLGNESY